MYMQMQTYREDISTDFDDTYKLDLPRQGLLSFILVEFESDQAAGAPFADATDGKWRMVDFIDDISIIANGRADIVTVPGTVAQYRAFLDQGVTAWDVIREYSGTGQSARFLINFGARTWDLNRALDLSRYDNVELNITNSCDDTEWDTDASLTVWLGWLRDYSMPTSEFYKLELWREITTAQDGREYLELPTGLPIRRLILQVYSDTDANGVAKTLLDSILQGLQLTYRNGQIEAWNNGFASLLTENYHELGFEQLVMGSVLHTADYGFDVGLGDVRGAAGISGARDGAESATVPTREGDRDDFTQKMESSEADSPVDYIMRGCGYQNCGVFRYDRDPAGADLLDPSPSGLGTVELELHTRDHADAADGTIRVVLDRVATAGQIAV